MQRTHQIKLTLAVCGLAALTGCATAPPRPPETTTIRCTIPEITAMPETKESQEKGGVEIAMVPAIYKAARKDKTTVQQVQASFGEALAMDLDKSKGPQVVVVQSTMPELLPQPNRLEFTVRINNKLSRVFRGQGAVVQFNVAGKLWPFGDTDYGEFVNGIVPPRNETTLKIFGPRLDKMPDKGTLGIFLYDVVTATDVAGNVTEKQNYTWYFNYTTKTVEETAEKKVARGIVTLDAYQQMMMQQQQESMRQSLQNLAPGQP